MVGSTAPIVAEGYGDEMRRAEREIRDPGELEDVIRRAEVCRLGMVDGGEPYIVPMNFGYRDGHLYFHCAREGRKLDVLRANPRVCFELEAGVRTVRGETACKWSTAYESVIGWGTATVLMDEEGTGGPDGTLSRRPVLPRPPLGLRDRHHTGGRGTDDRQTIYTVTSTTLPP